MKFKNKKRPVQSHRDTTPHALATAMKKTGESPAKAQVEGAKADADISANERMEFSSAGRRTW